MRMLNLGCGSRFHRQWVNVDWAPSAPGILVHDLRKPLPFEDKSFDIVYHSHVLEHFDRSDAERFLSECYRVCDVGGVIRVAVPDLEMIVTMYLQYLQGAIAGATGAAERYEWMMLEMYDQVVRTHSGGEMLQYLSHAPDWLRPFLSSRVGRSMLIEVMSKPMNQNDLSARLKVGIREPRRAWRYIRKVITSFLIMMLWGKTGKEMFNEVLFRMQGENHRWMYDRYSLPKALELAGFQSATIVTAHQSRIDNWASYGLDVDQDGAVYKPDSLFCEAVRAA